MGTTTLSTFIIEILVIQNTISSRYYVDPSTSSGGSGSSWNDALNTLDSALVVATKRTDEIWLKGGFTYTPSYGNPPDRAHCFVTNYGLTLYGGFDGTETTTNQRKINTAPSILSGDIGTIDDISDNCYHVIQYTRTLTLDNVIIQHGNANYEGYYAFKDHDNTLHRYGGAMITTDVLRSTSLHLTNVIIRNNTAINGGALWFAGSPMTLIEVVIKNSIFAHNKAIDGDFEGGYGGAIYEMFLANITLINTQFTANEAMNRGGAIYQDYGALLYATGCTFEYNKVNGWGGALFGEDRNSQTDGTFPQIISSVFRYNTAGLDGGAIFWYNDVIGTLHDTQFISNTAQGNGNAVALVDSELTSSSGNTLSTTDLYNETTALYTALDDTLSFDIDGELNDLYSVWNTMQTSSDIHPFNAADTLCYVDGDNTNSIQDGGSWSTAYSDIQQCLDALRSEGGEIWVGAGTYTPTSVPYWKQQLGRNTNLHKSFEMYDNIRMYGGFDGTEITRYERNWKKNPTYLSCQVTIRVQCNQLIFAADDTVIDGFIFEKAGTGVNKPFRRLANSISVDQVLRGKHLSSGAGVFSNSATTHVVNSIFHKLFSAVKGGAVYCIGLDADDGISQSPSFINVAFLGNRAVDRGGAISADAGCHFECTACTFKSNSCTKKGGAIYLDFACDPSFTNTTFMNNYAMESGGCIAGDGVSLSTFNGTNVFRSNSARMEGGCLYAGSGVGKNTQQGFEFMESPIFDQNYMANANNIGHNNAYGWPFSVLDIKSDRGSTPSASPTPGPTSGVRHEDIQPNVILFFVDDLKLIDKLSMFGPNDGYAYDEMTLANIEAFAKESVWFPSSYAGGPKCSPSRFALLTGRQPSRGEWAIRQTLRSSSGYFGANVSITLSRLYFNDSRRNIAYVLQHDATTPYYTGMVGKWHLQALDGGLGCSSLNSVPDAALYEKCTALVKAQGFDFVDAWYQGNIQNNDYFSHNPEWMLSQSQKFMDRAVNVEKKPFFLYFATTLTHDPSIEDALSKFSSLDTPKGTLTGDDIPSAISMDTRANIWQQGSAFAPNNRRKESDAARYWVDSCFGALISYLKENDLYDKTFILFMGDHGMRAKGMLYQLGTRVVNMVRYPPLFGDNGPYIMPNDFVVSNVDMASTILELTGVAQPKKYKMDGVSWLNDVQNEIQSSGEEQTCCDYRYSDMHNSHSIVSSSFQYIYRANRVISTDVDGPALFPYVYDEQQLYNLNADPGQQVNQINNISLANTIVTFQELMRQYIASICPVSSCKMPNVTFTRYPTMTPVMQPTGAVTVLPTQQSIQSSSSSSDIDIETKTTDEGEGANTDSTGKGEVVVYVIVGVVVCLIGILVVVTIIKCQGSNSSKEEDDDYRFMAFVDDADGVQMGNQPLFANKQTHKVYKL